MSTVRVIPLAVNWADSRKGAARNAYAAYRTRYTDFHKRKVPVRKPA